MNKSSESSEYSHFLTGKYPASLFVLASFVLLIASVMNLGQESQGERTLPTLEMASLEVQKEVLQEFQNHLLAGKDTKIKSRLEEIYTFVSANAGTMQVLKLHEGIDSENLYIRFDEPRIDKVIALIFQKSTKNNELNLIASTYFGDQYIFKERALELPNFVLPLDLSSDVWTVQRAEGTQALPTEKNDTETWVLLTEQDVSSNLLNISTWHLDSLLLFNDNNTLFYGTLFGYLLALCCYCIMVYSTAGTRVYLWYLGFSIAFSLHLMAISGYGFQYLWPNSPYAQQSAYGLSMGIGFFFLSKFTQSNLDTKYIWQNYIMNAIAGTLVLFSIMLVFFYDVVLESIMVIMTLIVTTAYLLICLWQALRGKETALFFLIVWLSVLLILIIGITNSYAMIPLRLDMAFVLITGFHILTVMIGSAIIYRYRQSYLMTQRLNEAAIADQARALEAKDKILRIKQDASEQLDKQVKLQTRQLERALGKLSSASRELELLGNLDGLTGLPNRHAFESSINQILLSNNNHSYISVAILDLDLFKLINDKYGHLAGDACLKHFAALLKESFTSDNFMFCRYGGEEFLIASTLDELDHARSMDKFRQQVSNEQVNTGAGVIRYTISIGVAGSEIYSKAEFSKLISLADKNLYLAKDRGRNLVVL